MSTPTPAFEPLSFNAGDSLLWSKSFPDYPSTLWTLIYYFSSLATSNNVTATGSGADYLVSIANTVSAGFKEGKLYWSAVVTNGSETHTLAKGVMDVLPNAATLGTFDGRTFERRMYDIITAALERRLPVGLENFTINGKSLNTMTNEALDNLREKYKGLVDQQENQARIDQGKKSKNIILCRFSRS